jgi:hypothetical protein
VFTKYTINANAAVNEGGDYAFMISREPQAQGSARRLRQAAWAGPGIRDTVINRYAKSTVRQERNGQDERKRFGEVVDLFQCKYGDAYRSTTC